MGARGSRLSGTSGRGVGGGHEVRHTYLSVRWQHLCVDKTRFLAHFAHSCMCWSHSFTRWACLSMQWAHPRDKTGGYFQVALHSDAPSKCWVVQVSHAFEIFGNTRGGGHSKCRRDCQKKLFFFSAGRYDTFEVKSV